MCGSAAQVRGRTGGPLSARVPGAQAHPPRRVGPNTASHQIRPDGEHSFEDTTVDLVVPRPPFRHCIRQPRFRSFPTASHQDRQDDPVHPFPLRRGQGVAVAGWRGVVVPSGNLSRSRRGRNSPLGTRASRPLSPHKSTAASINSVTVFMESDEHAPSRWR